MLPERRKNLHDVLNSIQNIENFIQKSEFDELLSNRMLQAALEREF